jgi:type II secretion system protein D
VQAADVEASLTPMLPQGTEVLLDRRANRFLISGTPQAHQTARNVLARLDQAPAAAQPAAAAAAPSQPVLKVLDCPTGRAAIVATALQEEFARNPEVRIVANAATSKVLVMAPADVQASVAAKGVKLGATVAPDPDAPRTENVNPIRRTVANAAATERPADVQLRTISGEELENQLLLAFGRQMTALSGAGPGVSAYRLPSRAGERVELWIDRSAHRVRIVGGAAASDSMLQVVRALDRGTQSSGESVGLIAVPNSRPADVEKTIEAIRMASMAKVRTAEAGDQTDRQVVTLPGTAVQPGPKIVPDERDLAAAEPVPAVPAKPDPAAKPGVPGKQDATPPKPPAGKEGEKEKTDADAEAEAEDTGPLTGPVRIERVEGTDALIIIGNKRDVERVKQMIRRLEQIAVKLEPVIETVYLRHVDGVALTDILSQLFSQVFAAREGTPVMLPLVRPNALFVVGRKESVDRLLGLVQRLDVDTPPEATIRVFYLRHASASSVQTTLQAAYPEGVTTTTTTGGNIATLAPRVRVTLDTRTNALIVQAAPRDMTEVATVISRLDVPQSDKQVELRLFKLTHTLASELATVLQSAVQSQASGQQQRTTTGQGAAPGGFGAVGGTGQTGTVALASSMLQFITLDANGQRQQLTSGILTDVTITPDASANTLVISAPANSMGLIDALIKQLDQPPAMRSEIKVFRLNNADASMVYQLLNELFLGQTGNTANQMNLPQRTAAGQGETSLVQLRFTYDPRTNTIVATGTPADLLVVDAILLRLDSVDTRSRKSVVYRLKNSPATEVSNALGLFLRNERNIERQLGPQMFSPTEQMEREVTVQPEVTTNSLIISATPRFFDEVMRLVEELDARPPMVVVQVLIASVRLTDDEEFGVELGLQDSLLYNRGLSSQGTLSNPAFAISPTPRTLSGPAPTVAGQSLTDFTLGRVGPTGFGGMVLSASSESVNILIRAMKQKQRLEILSSPKVMALNNQPAFLQIGQRVPRITSSSLSDFGQTNSTTDVNVGIILQIVPRISPDGIVVMEIDAERSAVGAESEGIPISVTNTGEVIRSPRIDTTVAQTTVSAGNGQTVVLAGLIASVNTDVSRRVPYLSDVPVLGNLFKYDSKTKERTELLILLTPQVVFSNNDFDRIKRIEAARMHWCLTDVIDAFGDPGTRSRKDEWNNGEVPVFYPDAKPGERHPGMAVPQGFPQGAEVVPAPDGQPQLAPPQPVGPVPGPGGVPPAGPMPDPTSAPGALQPGMSGAYQPPMPTSVPGSATTAVRLGPSPAMTGTAPARMPYASPLPQPGPMLPGATQPGPALPLATEQTSTLNSSNPLRGY